MQKKLVVLLGVPLLMAATEPNTKIHQEKIEAKVGSEIITSTDLKSVEDGLKAERPSESSKEIRQKALNLLVDQALVSEYLKKNGMEVADRDIDQQVAAVRAQYGIKTDAEMRALLEKQGISFDRFKSQIRSQKEQAQFRGLISSKIQDPTELEVLAYYKNNSDQFKSNYEYELAECVIPYGKDAKAAEKKAKDFQTKPAKFSECVKKYSQSPSAAQGGKLGKFSKGMLRDDIEAKIFGLKQNDIINMPMEKGIQLIKIEKRKDLGNLKFEAAKEGIRNRIRGERIRKEADRILTEQKAGPEIQVLN